MASDKIYIDIAEVKEIKKPVFKDLETFDNDKNNVIGEQVSLKQILSLKLFKMIQELEHKIINGRIKDKEAEKIRLEYIKTYVNACNCFNNISKDIKNDYDKGDLLTFVDTSNIELD